MVSWEEVHAMVSEHAGIQLSQGVCQNIAAGLNAQRPAEVADLQHLISTSPACHCAIHRAHRATNQGVGGV